MFHAKPNPRRTPRSPVGQTSIRRSWNMRKISADHFPMPRTVDRRATISSSLSRASRRESSTTVPSRTLVARSWREAALRADRPAARSTSVGVARRRSGVTSPSRARMSRPYIAWAAAPASCWKVTERTRVAKCVSVGLGKTGGPAPAGGRGGAGARPGRDWKALGGGGAGGERRTWSRVAPGRARVEGEGFVVGGEGFDVGEHGVECGFQGGGAARGLGEQHPALGGCHQRGGKLIRIGCLA